MSRAFSMLLLAMACTAGAHRSWAREPADLILHNGVVWTVDAGDTQASAVAVRENRIAAVGDDGVVLALAGPGTRVIDLAGAMLLPGFNDTHVHFASAAQFLEFNIMATSTQDEFVARVARLVDALPRGEWITGGFWGAYDEWALGSAGGTAREPFRPDLALVESLTREHPLLIQKFDSSQFAANRAALKAAGLDPDDPRSDGIEFQRDATGRPTGIFSGPGAASFARRSVPRRLSYERRVSQTLQALEAVARAGVTNVSDMSDDTQLEIYRQLQREGRLTVRVHFRYPLDRWPELAEQGIRAGSGTPWIRLGSLKGHIDGIMGTSTARFFEPYSNDHANRGRWRPLMVDARGAFVEGKFLKYMLDADRAGLQLTVHAIGDEANHTLLDYLEEVVRQNGERDRRFRLVHAQVLAADDFSRLAPLGVVSEVQPFHLSDDMRWMELRIGRERCGGAYAFKQIHDSGSRLCFGTDWPGTSAAEYPINPLLGLYAAVTRQTTTGMPAGGWFPEQRIDMKQAIRAYTYNSAYANFEEADKGSIEVGKLADLVVLSHNLLEVPPSEILAARVVYTIVDGKVVYER